MARRPAARRPAGRPLIGVTIGGGPSRPSPPRRGRRAKRLPNARAVVRRLAGWTGQGIGGGVRRAASTTGQVSSRAATRYADVRENRRTHGRRAVVRDLTVDAGGPLSQSQVQSRLLGLDTARALNEGRTAPVHAQVIRPIDTETLRRAAAPIRLSWWDRRRLPKDWAVDDVLNAQAEVTDHLATQLAARSPRPEPEVWGTQPDLAPPTRIHPVPTPGTSAAPAPRGPLAVIEPTTFADLANPAIEQATWTDELPAHAQAVVALTQQPVEGLRALAEYHRAAQSREDIVAAYDEAAAAAQAAMDQCQQAAQRAEDWATSVRLPDFSRAG